MTALPFSVIEPLELVARTRAGDDGAFASLVAVYQPRVFRWALALTGDQDEAEDVTQEVFVRVYRKLASFRGDGPLDAWLYRITRRIALRTRRPSTTHLLGVVDDVYTTDPGGRVDRQRALDLIRAIAATLPMRQRELFVLCDLEGRTPGEAAAILAIKDVSARASLFKARATIRRRILATHPCYGDD
jgi:RNA polymerase sigma-70 factor (ECF subfamily)